MLFNRHWVGGSIQSRAFVELTPCFELACSRARAYRFSSGASKGPASGESVIESCSLVEMSWLGSGISDASLHTMNQCIFKAMLKTLRPPLDYHWMRGHCLEVSKRKGCLYLALMLKSLNLLRIVGVCWRKMLISVSWLDFAEAAAAASRGWPTFPLAYTCRYQIGFRVHSAPGQGQECALEKVHLFDYGALRVVGVKSR